MARPKLTIPNKTCPVCAKHFRKSYNSAKFCSRACRDESQRKRETRRCPTCEGSFTCLPCSKSICCSLSCATKLKRQCQPKPRPVVQCAKCGKNFELKKKPHGRDYYGKFCSRVCSDSFNKNGAAKVRIVVCAFCGKQVEKRDWKALAKSNHCSAKCQKRDDAKIRVGRNHHLFKEKRPMACEICGTVRLVKPSLVSRFRSCSKRCNAALAQLTYPRTSSIEKKMAEAFACAGLNPSAQFAIDWYTIDFAFIGCRVAVECDGKYWHGRKEQRVKDIVRDKWLRKHGWSVIRLGEDEINESPDSCVAKVVDRIRSKGSMPLFSSSFAREDEQRKTIPTQDRG